MSEATFEKFESWGPVPGFEGLYEVSDAGRVRRVGKACKRGAGRGGGVRLGRVLAQQIGKRDRYHRVTLWKDGHCYARLVHVLVAEVFVGPRPVGKEVNHADGNKSRNAAGNLEYLTHAENCAHAYATGLRKPARLPTGEQHPGSRLTAGDVLEIRRLYVPGKYGTPRLAKRFGVDHTTVRAIVRGETWKELL